MDIEINVKIKIITNVNVVIATKTRSCPSRPFAAHDVSGFDKSFRQDKCQTTIGTRTDVSNKLTVGRIHSQTYLKSDVGAVFVDNFWSEMNGWQNIDIICLFHSTAQGTLTGKVQRFPHISFSIWRKSNTYSTGCSQRKIGIGNHHLSITSQGKNRCQQ